MPRLTQQTLTTIRPKPTKYIVHDDLLHGFGVRIWPSGRRVYIVRYRVRGQPVYRERTLGTTAELKADQAREMATTFLAQARLGIDIASKAPASQTVAEVAAAYLHESRSKKKPRSHSEDARNCTKHLLPVLGDTPIAAVTQADVERLHYRLRDTPFAANRAITLLSAICTFAERHQWLPRGSNPVKGIRLYREAPRQRFLSDEELSRLWQALSDEDAAGGTYWGSTAAIRLLLMTGARLREITTLEWAWIDWRRKLIHLPDSKTGAKTLWLSDHALDYLRQLYDRQATPGQYILPSPIGQAPLADPHRAWWRIRKRADLPDVRLHDLRHTYASVLLRQGYSLPVIAKLLGHTTIRHTQRYAHLADDAALEAARQGGAALRQIVAAQTESTPHDNPAAHSYSLHRKAP